MRDVQASFRHRGKRAEERLHEREVDCFEVRFELGRCEVWGAG